MADNERPPSYNPEFSCVARHSVSPFNRLSPPPYCDNTNSENIQRLRRTVSSLPRRPYTSRSREALSDSNISSINQPLVISPASQFTRRTDPTPRVNDGRRRCHSVGRVPRQRLQLATTGSEGRCVANDTITAEPPAPPPRRRLAGEPTGSPLKCLHRFNMYNHDDVARRGTHTLTCVDVSDSGNVLVVDSHTMFVHVFSNLGSHLQHAFKILGVRAGCFWKEQNLVLATHRGVKICQLDGSVETDIYIGPVVCTKRYKLHFLAVQRQCLTVYGGLSSKVTKGATIRKVRSRHFLRRGKCFVEIADTAINNNMFIVLDTGRNVIYRIDENGTKMSKVVPNGHLCGDIHFAPGVAIDAHNNIIVCDGSNKQLLQFHANGRFVCCLLNFSVRVGSVEVDGVPLIHGITTNYLGQLFVTLSGDGFAEVRMYEL